MSNSDQLVAVLNGMIGKANVIQDPVQLRACAVDGVLPKAVVSPGNAEEISKILAYARSAQLAVAPRGNGTKMAAGNKPKKIDLVLSTLRLNRIVDYDVANLSLSVEAGMTLADVQKKLAGGGKGNFLPLDPPYTANATIGGIIAANSSGPRRYIYGTARDLLLGIKAVSPAGDIITFGGKTMKNVSGYDMTKLMIGTWGGLGVITEITTKLLPLPEASATLLIFFDELAAAGLYIRKLVHSSLLPSAIELLDSNAAGRLGEKAKYLLALSLEGVVEAVERQITEISDSAKKEGASSVKVLKGAEDLNFWVRVRDFAAGPEKEAGPPVILKSNFLISKHAELLAVYEKAARAAGIEAAFIMHAGNGILYTFIQPDKEAAKVKALVELIGSFTAEAVKQEGNLVIESCQSGIKEKVAVWGEPRADYVLMRSLKAEIDPAGVLNPGRFVGGI
jgi:glycolate oxidase FAD binding subunit